MAANWSLKGTYFESCNCDILCPCIFAKTPTKGYCQALAAWRIDDGHMDDVRLDGLIVAAWLHAPTNLLDGQWRMALYLDDAVRMNPNLPPVVGKEAIREYYLASWAEADGDVTNEAVGVRVSGDLATAWDTWSGRIVPADGSEPYDDQGKWSATWLRQPDGSWKTLWDIWSSDLPPRPES